MDNGTIMTLTRFDLSPAMHGEDTAGQRVEWISKEHDYVCVHTSMCVSLASTGQISFIKAHKQYLLINICL